MCIGHKFGLFIHSPVHNPVQSPGFTMTQLLPVFMIALFMFQSGGPGNEATHN